MQQLSISINTLKEDCTNETIQKDYNFTITLFQTYTPYYFSIWLVSLLLMIFFVVFASYLIYKSCQIKTNRFFLLISFLFILESFALEQGLRTAYNSLSSFGSLPLPLNCAEPKQFTEIEKVQKGQDHRNRVITWMVCLFLFSYFNAELIFSMKYWTLSLKISSLM